MMTKSTSGSIGPHGFTTQNLPRKMKKGDEKIDRRGLLSASVLKPEVLQYSTCTVKIKTPGQIPFR